MEYSKKFLIVGATGLIGKAVTEELNDKYLWQGTCFSKNSCEMISLDVLDKTRIKEVFGIEKPTTVIYCVNLSGGVDFCERNPGLSKKIHFEGTVNIAKECLKHKSRFIFISSECVFDGKKEAYKEEDEVNPLNVYGKCKAKAEKWIRGNLKDYLIVRTMSVYGWDPNTSSPNPVMQIYFSILNKKNLFAPTFRWGNPTYVKDLARAIVELSLSNDSGVFHITGPTFINRYEWLKTTCEFLGWNSSFILPLESMPENMVPRPYRIRLNTDKFCNKFNTKINGIQTALRMLKRDISLERVKCKA